MRDIEVILADYTDNSISHLNRQLQGLDAPHILAFQG